MAEKSVTIMSLSYSRSEMRAGRYSGNGTASHRFGQPRLNSTKGHAARPSQSVRDELQQYPVPLLQLERVAKPKRNKIP
jgi:hypothetical protein